MANHSRAVILLSGGLDSSTCLAKALRDGREPFPLSFSYGQIHALEIKAAAAVACHFGVPTSQHRIVDLGRSITGSALTGEQEIPLDRKPDAMHGDIPVTYVPARNLIFLSFAVSYAEAVDANAVYIGVNVIDYSGYPDCRPAFISAFTEAARLGTRVGVEGHPVDIRTPLIGLAKADIIRLAVELEVPFELTHSCYLGTRPACGRCDACVLRIEGFRDAGLRDPLPYAAPLRW